jgi:hypothetical protein
MSCVGRGGPGTAPEPLRGSVRHGGWDFGHTNSCALQRTHERFALIHLSLRTLPQTYDPVTSLGSAKYANSRLGDNARLIQQVDGWGHCTPSHVSYCTARAARAYMLHGEPPRDKHTLCAVDQKPWEEFDGGVVGPRLLEDEQELIRAWGGLAEDLLPR